MAHTKTPWLQKRGSTSCVYIESRIGGGMLQEVAVCGPCEGGPDEQEANARLIVRSVNSFDAMRDALLECAEALELALARLGCPVEANDGGGVGRHDAESYGGIATLERVRAALKLAEGGE